MFGCSPARGARVFWPSVGVENRRSVTITRLVFSDRCAPVDLAVRRVLHSMGTSRDTSWQDDKSLKRVASARLETGEVSVAGLPAVSLSFGVRAHFLLEARKKSLLQG